MTNVFATPEKGERRDRLFEIGIEALKAQGWAVDRVPGLGKSSVRRIKKDSEEKLVAIRTTQDRWIAFPRTGDDSGWLTLDDVDAVVAVSVDDKEQPKFALVHLFEQTDIKTRFDRAYAARLAAGRSIPIGRGVWLSLYDRESVDVATLVGAGAGLASPPIARAPLKREEFGIESIASPTLTTDEAPLTIAEAKRRLARTFGVDPSSIKITVEA
jgi:hypothetical protein